MAPFEGLAWRRCCECMTRGNAKWGGSSAAEACGPKDAATRVAPIAVFASAQKRVAGHPSGSDCSLDVGLDARKSLVTVWLYGTWGQVPILCCWFQPSFAVPTQADGLQYCHSCGCSVCFLLSRNLVLVCCSASGYHACRMHLWQRMQWSVKNAMQ